MLDAIEAEIENKLSSATPALASKKNSLSSLHNKEDIFKSYDQIEMQKVAVYGFLC